MDILTKLAQIPVKLKNKAIYIKTYKKEVLKELPEKIE